MNANDYVMIADGWSGASLLLKLPESPTGGERVRVFRAAGQTSVNVQVKTFANTSRIYNNQSLSAFSGSPVDYVNIETYTCIDIVCVDATSGAVKWAFDYLLSQQFPLALATTGGTSNASLDIAAGDTLVWDATDGGGGSGAFINRAGSLVGGLKYEAKTSNFNAALGYHYSVNTSGGAVTATLPTNISGDAGEIRFKLMDATNPLTVATFDGDQKIDESNANLSLSVAKSSVTLISNRLLGTSRGFEVV
jgi:hypothetical protein